jgi:hypothetical protein
MTKSSSILNKKVAILTNQISRVSLTALSFLKILGKNALVVYLVVKKPD